MKNIYKWRKTIGMVLAVAGSIAVLSSISARADQKLSSVRIIRDNTEKNAESERETEQVAELPKVYLKEYSNYESLSAVSYEIVENPPKREAVLISDQSRNDVVISEEPTPSVVSDVEEGYFAFSTYGWGHCVGMSQNGANFYAIYGGWNYQDILFHYYPGTVLMNTGTAETEMIMVQDVPGNSLQQVSEIVNREMGSSFNVEA
ncbi:MAG: hypothetical protein K2H89_12115, partial [Oscillospiraceae bacterium]|nr:hypothetical protein [Oscillospiraceae bacterium]